MSILIWSIVLIMIVFGMWCCLVILAAAAQADREIERLFEEEKRKNE